MNLHSDYSERVVLNHNDLPWIASPEAGVKRRLLDRCGDEVARATSVVRYEPGAGVLRTLAGARLASSHVADAWVGAQSGVLILVVRVAAVFLTLWFIPLQGLERGALILFACLPPAVFNFMLADKFQVEPNKVASTVIVGHLLSLAFLPLGIWLAFIQLFHHPTQRN